jgi:tetratricopeptide (TPR) repeat protein
VDRSLDEEIVSDSTHAESHVTQAPLATGVEGGIAQPGLAFPASSHRSPPNPRARAFWVSAVCGLLLLAVGLVFGQTVHHDFIGCDDETFVSQNPHVTSGITLSGLWWAFTDGPFGEWYPLTSISHMLDCQLYGLNPGGHYVTNVLLHAASSVLLFLVLLRMTGDLWPSAWVAAVFAIHPLHVESVAWLAERRDVLSGLFFMLTLGAYALYAERPSLARYLAVAGCFALGLMSKPMLVTVPFLLLLLDYWPLDRFRQAAGTSSPAESTSWLGRLPVGWRLLVEKIPLMALAAVSCGIVLSTHVTMRPDAYAERLSLGTPLANALVSYAAYLSQSFYPVDLSAYYTHPGNHLPIASVAGALVLLMGITALAIYGWRRWPFLPVGWLWFLGMLVPVIGLVPNGPHARADRYTYLSQIGLSIALAWGVWLRYRSRQSVQALPWRRWMLAGVSGGAILLLAVVAWRQTSYWRNAETLWTHALACDEHDRMAQCSLASFYLQQGKTEEAIDHARAALAAKSVDLQLIAKSDCLLGDALTKQGKIDEAITHYEQAARVFPDSPIFHERLAMSLASRDKHDRAIAEWREVIRLDPQHLQAHVGLADALLAHGDFGEAVAECNEILRQQASPIEAIVIFGAALAAQGSVDEGLPYLTRAVELQPDNAKAQFYLGLALYGRGPSRSAIAHLDKAVELQPDNVPMLWQTAWILATSPDSTLRDGTRAVGLAQRAIDRCDGQEVRAFDALAAALAETEKFMAAVEIAEQASTMALDRGDATLAEAIGERARLYRQGVPYRQPASRGPTGHAWPEVHE